MTSAVLKAQIDTHITDKTEAGSLTNTDLGADMKEIVDYVDQEVGFKVYTALVSQSGTDAPTAKVLKNTLGATISFDRTGAGNFSATGSSNVFTANKTSMSYSFNSNGSFPAGSMFFYSLGAQFFIIETKNSGVAADGVITDAFIEIRVYP